MEIKKETSWSALQAHYDCAEQTLDAQRHVARALHLALQTHEEGSALIDALREAMEALLFAQRKA